MNAQPQELEEDELQRLERAIKESPTLQIAAFGAEVREFIENDNIGKYIVSRAKQDIAEAAAALLDADPSKPEEIRAIQNKAKVAGLVRDWLGAAVRDGINAETSAQQERDTRR